MTTERRVAECDKCGHETKYQRHPADTLRSQWYGDCTKCGAKNVLHRDRPEGVAPAGSRL